MATHPQTARLSNLVPLDGWEHLASGVWRARFGQADRELAYTNLAAREPRIETLDALPTRPFPFAETPILAHKSEDRLIQVRVPVDAGESIYGFGLQFDGIKKSKKVLELNVDHWARGGAGAEELARSVVSLAESGRADFRPLYRDDEPLMAKIKRVVREVYGADDVIATVGAK